MTVKSLRVLAVAALLFVLQQSVFAKMSVLAVHPDVLLLFALVVGITGGRDRGAMAGFVAGLMADVFMTSPLGMSAFAYTVAGYAVGMMAEHSSGLPWVTSLIAMAGTLIALFVFLILGLLADDIHVSVSHFLQIAFVETLGNAILAPIVAIALRNAWRTSRDIAW